LPDKFQPFSLLHAGALVAIALGTSLATYAARQARTRNVPTPSERVVGIAFVLVWLTVHGWFLIPPRFDPVKTLPLQMCHLSALGAGAYLATRARWLAALLYFWGFGLNTQALITPTLEEGPATPAFWYFWLSHGMIVGVAAYALAVHRYRPTWRDWRFACGTAAVYAAIVIPVDLVLDANYGFLGPTTPGQPTLVDFLGPWPARLLIIFGLVAGVMALLMLPWMFARQRAARSSP